ncbi:hypothetical protein H0H92_010612 [Tricholoma furcatifolium]|nr:hypothetical protein H0H92_010612 [Tricholoma furcatifolium]
MAATPAQALYARDIPGLRVNHPTLPNMLGDVDLNLGILAGSPIDAAHLRNAEIVAKIIKLYHSILAPILCLSYIINAASEQGKDGISVEAVEEAELRLNHVASEHSRAHSGPVREGEMLQLLRDLNDKILVLQAESYNTRVIARNGRTVVDSCMPLKKTIPGQDRDLARAVDRISREPGRGRLRVPAQAPAVGALPQNFNENIGEYSMRDIAKMVLFYNDNFGIEAGDNEADARLKFHRFLSLP